MGAAWIGRGRIKAGLVGGAGADRLGEGVVDLEDCVFGDVTSGRHDFAGSVRYLGAQNAVPEAELVTATCAGIGLEFHTEIDLATRVFQSCSVH